MFVYMNACREKVEVEIMERMAEAWQAIEAKNARHDTSHKLHREKPMFCMDRFVCVKCMLFATVLPFLLYCERVERIRVGVCYCCCCYSPPRAR